MLVLLSPSKTMDFGVHQSVGSTQPIFLEQANEVMAKLQKLSMPKWKALMAMSDNVAKSSKAYIGSWNSENTVRQQALYSYTGEVYRGLDATSLTEKSVDYAQNHLLILSGVYGMLRAKDEIQPYRLEMQAKLSLKRNHKNLYNYWSPLLGAGVDEMVESSNCKAVVNLASDEYFKAVKPNLKSDVITVNFLENKNGEFKRINVYAKKARGFMARFIIENKVKTISKLKTFNTEGYGYNKDLSEPSALVFTR